MFSLLFTVLKIKNYNHIYIFNVIFRDEEKPKNPMVELFYGRFLAVGVLEGIVTHVYFFITIEVLLAFSSFVMIVTLFVECFLILI